MKNKKGFISMSLVYSFLVLFLFLMMSIINCYLKKNTYLEALDKQVEKDISITKDAKQSLFSTILEDNIVISSNTLNFSKIANDTAKNGNGLFYVEDKDKTDENNDGYGSKIYFFRGSVDNNYVVFGSEIKRDSSKKVSEIKDICWRIIRTNEDGSIRLLYSGLQQSNGSCPTSGLYINLTRFDNEYNSLSDGNSNVQFNKKNTDNAYVGYTYGEALSELSSEKIAELFTGKTNYDAYLHTHYHNGSGKANDSNIKKVLDNYFLYHTNMGFSTELENESVHMYQPAGSSDATSMIKLVDDRMANGVFCNDRYTEESKINEGLPYEIPTAIFDVDMSYGIATTNENTLYEGYYRGLKAKPTYSCNQSIDRYTLRTISGGTNQNYNALTYPIGLPTIDDLMFAGGTTGAANAKYFMKSDRSYWLMTPTSNVSSAYVTAEGKISTQTVTNYAAIRPVISVDPTILVMRGSGLINEPYILN